MTMLDDFSEKAKDLAFVGASKAMDVAESAKVSMDIVAEKRELDKIYRSIGRWFVSEYQGDMSDEVRMRVEAANACKMRIAALREVKNGKVEPVVAEAKLVCPLCKEESNGNFCASCGAPMDM